jgi:CheY-like chemotaxis protein
MMKTSGRQPGIHRTKADVHRIADRGSQSDIPVRPSAPARILVVDPDDDTRTRYRQWLALPGCEVVEASDGREAIVIALTGPLALVVTEVTLPFVDGVGLCDVLRRDPATAHVPILVITGDTRVRQIERVRRMGADAVLLKPAAPESIVAETRRLMAHASEGRGREIPMERTAVGRPALLLPQRVRLSKSLARVTTTMPPSAPPVLACPSCDGPLVYETSYVGGVSERHLEQWDHYRCAASCGAFEYRHRTRKLRLVV